MARASVPLRILPLTAALFAACGSSPQKQAREAHQALASWTATAELSAQLSQSGDLPQQYVRQLDEAIQRGKQKARSQTEAAE
jgi:ferritin-like metal-binding protein YciE